jgi:hypothetical protein
MKALHYLQSLGISVQFAKLPLVSDYIHSLFGYTPQTSEVQCGLQLVDPPMVKVVDSILYFLAGYIPQNFQFFFTCAADGTGSYQPLFLQSTQGL